MKERENRERERMRLNEKKSDWGQGDIDRDIIKQEDKLTQI